MTWTDPEAGKAFFETNDQPTEANFETYIADNLLSVEHVIDTTTSDLDIVSTTAETTLYSVLIPGNSMGTVGEVTMRIIGDHLSNDAAAGTINVRVKFGGSTIITHTFEYGDSATRRYFEHIIRVMNQSATGTQLISSNPNASAAATVGSFSVQVLTAAIDTTVDQTLLVTAQWTNSSANHSHRRLSARTTLARN